MPRVISEAEVALMVEALDEPIGEVARQAEAAGIL